MKKTLLLVLISSLFFSCNRQNDDGNFSEFLSKNERLRQEVVSENKNQKNNDDIVPEIEPAPEIEQAQSSVEIVQKASNEFSGITDAQALSSTTVKLFWTPIESAATYNVFYKENNKLIFLDHINAPASSIVVDTLIPGKEYTLFVRVMDKSGVMDQNNNAMTLTLREQGDFSNEKYLSFKDEMFLKTKDIDTILTRKTYSVSMWIKAREHQKNANLFSFYDRLGELKLGVFLDKNGFSINYIDIKNQNLNIKVPYVYTNMIWHHVVLIYTGFKVKLYINGREKANVKTKLAKLEDYPAYIGSTGFGINRFIGEIDEVSLWEVCLTEKKVLEVYNDRKPGNLLEHSKRRRLKAWWRMGDTPGDTNAQIRDEVGGNHLKLIRKSSISTY